MNGKCFKIASILVVTVVLFILLCIFVCEVCTAIAVLSDLNKYILACFSYFIRKCRPGVSRPLM
jgi:hypothetical protein